MSHINTHDPTTSQTPGLSRQEYSSLALIKMPEDRLGQQPQTVFIDREPPRPHTLVQPRGNNVHVIHAALSGSAA